MSLSATTASSMSAVETESFSNPQLTLLMLFGGEVFTSMLALILRSLKLHYCPCSSPSIINHDAAEHLAAELELPSRVCSSAGKNSPSKYLVCVTFMYMLIVQLSGYIGIKIYLSVSEDAREVLKHKGIDENIFAVFTTVSSFSNCGFLPTNESMIPFKGNSGLLLIVGSMILLGNTMYPIGLRLMVLSLGRIGKRKEFEVILKEGDGHYGHLMSGKWEMWMLGATAGAFLMLQTVLFVCLEWNSGKGILHGMNKYEKLIGAWFMSVNSRHAGESIVDLSTLSSAVLALTVVMMSVAFSLFSSSIYDFPAHGLEKIRIRLQEDGKG